MKFIIMKGEHIKCVFPFLPACASGWHRGFPKKAFFIVFWGKLVYTMAKEVKEMKRSHLLPAILAALLLVELPLTAPEREALLASAAVLEKHTRLANDILAGL